MKTRLVLILLPLCLLLACAKKPTPTGSLPATSAQLADLREFPQNLAIFAKQAGENLRLVDAAAQERLDRRFESIYFGPWHMRKTSMARREVAGVFGRARGYKDGVATWTPLDWAAMRGNAALERFPSRAVAAITTRQTDLRELPTHERRFSEPTPNIQDNPFDNFQYSSLAPGTPLLIAHTSNDGRWHYVECPIAGGWVDAADVALASPEFRARWQTGRYAALIRDNIPLHGAADTAGIGAVFPIVRAFAGGHVILAPKRGPDGNAVAVEIRLASADAVAMPMPLTPANVAKVGDVMMGQRYGWGGMLGLRDCSAMLRDLFTPFGIWLPRNSRSQARSGAVISLAGMSASAKNEKIMRAGRPFLSLVGMPGHITLYVGKWHGRAAIFHNVWGLRIVRDGDDDERFVIGRAVVTSIMPGKELKELYLPVTFADRIKTLTTLGPR